MLLDLQLLQRTNIVVSRLEHSIAQGGVGVSSDLAAKETEAAFTFAEKAY